MAQATRRPIHIRYTAVRALGQWVPDSRTTVDTATDLLNEVAQHPELKQGWAGLPAAALAALGRTLERAVPVLEQLSQDTNPATRVAALIALWNHRPGDEKLRAELATHLAMIPQPVLNIMTRLGPRAAVFAPRCRG